MNQTKCPKCYVRFSHACDGGLCLTCDATTPPPSPAPTMDSWPPDYVRHIDEAMTDTATDQQLFWDWSEVRGQLHEAWNRRAQSAQSAEEGGDERREGHSKLVFDKDRKKIVAVKTGWSEGAIRLAKSGYAYVVSIERDGKWIDVIRDSSSSPSHIVEPLGIVTAIKGHTV